MKRMIRASEWIVAICGTLIGIVLLVAKIVYSFDKISENYYFNLHHVLLGGGIYILLMCGVILLTKRIQSDRKCIILNIGITLLFEIVFCLSLILGAKFYFSSDAGAVYNLAVRFLQGDYSAVIPRDSYLAIYPHQYGMIFCFEMIMKIFGTVNGMIIQLMNIGLTILGTLAGYGIVWKIKPERTAVSAFSILQITFFPFFFYVAVSYGDLPAVCLTTVAVYAVTKVFEGKKFYRIWMIIASTSIILSCVFKKNALICLIAIILTSILMMCRQFDVKKVLWLMMTAFLAIVAVPIIQKTYELQAGRESGGGIPMITYVAMSMQEGLGGPGSWNGYHADLFLRKDYDHDATVEQAKRDIKESLSGFLADPDYMFEFYSRKLAYQWTDGTFDGVEAGIGSGFAADKSSWQNSIYSGNARTIFNIVANWHQSAVYLIFVLSMFWMIRDLREKKEICFEKMTLSVMLIGGFLFSFIWESSSRYVMIYYVMMLPIAATTTSEIYEKVCARRTITK